MEQEILDLLNKIYDRDKIINKQLLLLTIQNDKIKGIEDEMNKLKSELENISNKIKYELENTKIKSDNVSTHYNSDKCDLDNPTNPNNKKWIILMNVNNIDNSWKGILPTIKKLLDVDKHNLINDAKGEQTAISLFQILKYLLETYYEYCEAGIGHVTDYLMYLAQDCHKSKLYLNDEHSKYIINYIKLHKMEKQITQYNKDIYDNLVEIFK